ncbi:MAG: hypothetical protein NVS1B7_6020 [Candidatus Saccharimonadales bacterium]
MEKVALSTKIIYLFRIITVYAFLIFLLLFILNPFILSKPQTKLPFKGIVSAQESPPPTRKVITGKPVRIVIPSIQVDLPIDDGIYNASDGTWSLSSTKAQFASPSSPANDFEGNTFIYGHSSKHVFGSLHSINVGDTAQLYTDNGLMFSYSFMSAENIKPDNLTILHYQGSPMLTIQTCTGNWYELRRLFYFGFVKVQS